MNTLSNYWFLLRYGIVGICGGLIQTGMLYLWVDILHLEAQYLIGAILGFCIALAVTFTLQKYWTFRDASRAEIKKQFAAYTTIALLSLGANVLLLHTSKLLLEHFGFNFFHIWYLLSQVAIIGMLAAISFLANYFLTFGASRSASSEA